MLFAIQIILTIIGFFSFLFFFWRKLKDDYTGPQVFTSGYYSIVGLFIGFCVSRLYLPGVWLWISILCSLGGFLIAQYRFKFRFFESFEGWIVGILNVILWVNLFELISDFSSYSLVHFIAVLLAIGVYFYINKRYKKYVWYRSGREGFSGLLVAGLYLVFRASFLLFSGIMNKHIIIEALALSFLGFSSFFAIYNLSKKDI